ncbi:MAG: pyruvate, phosphate dikinase [Bacilli bacterium]|nr:pyruvate, phosphate dikinase [Bacilli bacterium]
MKYVYSFKEGNKDMKNILGGKGANLAEMTNLNLPVPPGFTITTEACHNYYENNGSLKKEIEEEILEHIKNLEIETGKTFGTGPKPLLISVRSGAPVSMPGMMDTILNLGMNNDVVESLIKQTNNPRFVYDSYRRLIMMYADVVKGYDRNVFESHLEEYKKTKNVIKDLELNADDLKKITLDYLNLYEKLNKSPFPADPTTQIIEAISSVFRSWNNDRAIYYRKMNQISDHLGTAVNVQTMVYGNIGETSGTGVAFTRNPSTGEKKLYGEFLMNAQGEDVVAGTRTPQPIETLNNINSKIYQQFLSYSAILENHYKDMQDMEFTIEEGKLYMLQTRNGKRTPTAALKIAVDMVHEGLITKTDALLRLNPLDLQNVLHSRFKSHDKMPIAKGLAASPGVAVGKVYFNAQDVIEAKKNNIKAILVRNETSPEDIEGMHHAEGILTCRGGMTSHAAVVARGMGVCCVSGCETIKINEITKEISFPNHKLLKEGETISIDGSTGNIYEGTLEQEENLENNNLQEFLSWTDEIETIKVKANADTEQDALTAKMLGAKGIGLCRTEHMFFSSNRIFAFRKMILSNNMQERVSFLNELLPYQREDFYKLFKASYPNSVVIRYLDPPLHEFLPKEKNEKQLLASTLNISLEDLENRIINLQEINPMMGHRGCRLAITYPEIAIMQTKAIIEACILLLKENISIVPEIMIPLTGDQKEFEFVKKIVDDTAKKIMKDHNVEIRYQVGTMIELPRACVMADKIANSAEFFSFGTNDLTQMTYGFSRDDSNKFLPEYLKEKLLKQDPFKTIDQEGVGSLMKVAISIAKNTRPDISLGVCGEHAGDPQSIKFFKEIGLDYVSCSPYRIPVAKLAAAQAAIKSGKQD